MASSLPPTPPGGRFRGRFCSQPQTHRRLKPRLRGAVAPGDHLRGRADSVHAGGRPANPTNQRLKPRLKGAPAPGDHLRGRRDSVHAGGRPAPRALHRCDFNRLFSAVEHQSGTTRQPHKPAVETAAEGRSRAGRPPAWSRRFRPRRWTASAPGALQVRFQSPFLHNAKPRCDFCAAGPSRAASMLAFRLRRWLHIQDGGAGGPGSGSRLGGLDQRGLDVPMHRRLPTQVGPFVEQQ